MTYDKVPKIVCYDCVNRHHLVAACPKCDTGVVVATCPEDYNGIADSFCNDCSAAVAFYVVIKERKAWLLSEPLEVVDAHQKKTSRSTKEKTPNQQASS
jgi:hypothetical protein